MSASSESASSESAAPDDTIALPTSPEALLARLAELGIAAETVRHDAVFTVEQTKASGPALAGFNTKNLFLKDKKGRFFLVVAEHERRIDLKRLHESIGASGRLSFGTAEQLMALLGVTPGSVCAFSVINDTAHAVTLVLDASMMQAERVNAHPLVNTMTTSVARDDLFAFFRSTGHEPLIVALPEPAAAPDP
jgi:Ala-tRNA(Pro) deacylase